MSFSHKHFSLLKDTKLIFQIIMAVSEEWAGGWGEECFSDNFWKQTGNNWNGTGQEMGMSEEGMQGRCLWLELGKQEVCCSGRLHSHGSLITLSRLHRYRGRCSRRWDYSLVEEGLIFRNYLFLSYNSIIFPSSEGLLRFANMVFLPEAGILDTSTATGYSRETTG